MSEKIINDFSHMAEKNELLQFSKDGKPIEHVKFLYILYYENLTWKCQINMVTKYCRK